MSVFPRVTQYVDDVAQATRVAVVAAGGSGGGGSTLPSFTPGLQRVSGAATTNIAAGARSISVYVEQEGSGADSPTIDGDYCPVGTTVSWSAPEGGTLGALSVVTQTGDVVLIATVV